MKAPCSRCFVYFAPSLQVKNKMSLESFRRNLRGVNDNTDFPVEFLDAIYYSIIKVSLSLNHSSSSITGATAVLWACWGMSPCHASAADLSQPPLLISGRFKADFMHTSPYTMPHCNCSAAAALPPFS